MNTVVRVICNVVQIGNVFFSYVDAETVVWIARGHAVWKVKYAMTNLAVDQNRAKDLGWSAGRGVMSADTI